MKVAIAGSGNVARYLIEELSSYGHQVVVLTRSVKSENAFEQRQTDYSVASLVHVLDDIDALVSTVTDWSNPLAGTEIQLNMLEACKQSKKTKTFIPSEWTSNVEDYPEQPMPLAENNRIIHERFMQETSIRWTIISNSWFVDYVLPQQQRYLRNIGQLWPMDYSSKVFTIYGPGTQSIDFTSVRDVAKAVAVLLDSKEPWEPYTYLSGQQMTWNELFAVVKKWDPRWTSFNKPLAETIRQITDDASPESVAIGHFEILGYAGASSFPKEKVQMQRTKYFGKVHFRTVEEILDAAAKRPDQII